MRNLLQVNLWPVLVLLAGGLVHGGLACPLHASVEVQTADGRVLRGEIDSRSNHRLLWVRRADDQIVLATSIRWPNVRSATIDGAPVEPSALQQNLQQHVSDGPRMFLAEYFASKIPVTPHAPKSLAVPVPPATQHSGVSSRIASIRVDAVLVNLDRDVEPDGLEVAVMALNTHGVPIPVRGNIYVRLWGHRSKMHGRAREFEELQRWAEPVRREHFIEGAAVYALRFRTLRPEFDLALWSHALLSVRLGIHGQGNFEASVPVAIRHFNPFRDSLQQNEGRRFFREEMPEN